MATQHTLDKLDELIDVSDMDINEVKFVLKNWDDAQKKTQNAVIASVKELDRIPPHVQLDLISAHEKALAAIGELLAAEAQDLVVEKYPEDIPVLLRKIDQFKVVSDSLWAELSEMAAQDQLTSAAVQRCIVRKDCPAKFAKALGYTQADFLVAQQRTRRTFAARAARQEAKLNPPPVQETAPVRRAPRRPADTIDDDFTDPRSVASAVRTVRRA